MYKMFKPNTLLCFSPGVMAATIIIELALLVWVLLRSARTATVWLIGIILATLAGFQWAEFNVCSINPLGLTWSRIGYAFITMLPPLGLHLIASISGRTMWYARAGYGLAAVFIANLSLAGRSLLEPVCTGNYVIFSLIQPWATLYGLYYFGLLFLGIGLSLTYARATKGSRSQALTWMAVGYSLFVVPTLIVNVILPYTYHAIPSIMCGFAVLFALVLGFKVAPLVAKRRARAIWLLWP